MIETLEQRVLCYAPVPSGYVKLGTVQIRAAANTYTSPLTLQAKTPYFLVATGQTFTATDAYDGDSAFASSSTTTTSWGISVTVGSDTAAPSAWGAQQSDRVYGQTFTPTSTGPLSFSFANDGTPKVSTLAVTVYAQLPAIDVATIHNNVAGSSVAASSLVNGAAYIPLNTNDWDHNGLTDDLQTAKVPSDKFLLPITLPAIAGDAQTAHLQISVPHGLRVWLNPDRSGVATGVGLRVSKPRTVYVEAIDEQPHHAAADLTITFPIDGVTQSESLPIVPFTLAGPTTAANGATQVFSSDATVGQWSAADSGTLNATATVKGVQFANVTWADTASDSTIQGLVDFDVDPDFVWAWGVQIEA